MLLGPRGSTDVLEGLPGSATKRLAARLKALLDEGLIEQWPAAPGARAKIYALTERGRALEPVVLALGRFGSVYLTEPAPGDRIDLRWFMLSMKRRYRGCSHRWSAHIVSPSRRWQVRFGGDAAIDVRDGDADAADVRIEAQELTLLYTLAGRLPVEAAMNQHGMMVEGSRAALDDLIACTAPARR